MFCYLLCKNNIDNALKVKSCACGIPPIWRNLVFRISAVYRLSGNISPLCSPYCVIVMTGAEGYNVPDIVCDIYFAGVRPCLGGLLAVDGHTGRKLWRHYSAHEVFAVNCNRDLNADSVLDCIVAGRVGVCVVLALSMDLRYVWIALRCWTMAHWRQH